MKAHRTKYKAQRTHSEIKLPNQIGSFFYIGSQLCTLYFARCPLLNSRNLSHIVTSQKNNQKTIMKKITLLLCVFFAIASCTGDESETEPAVYNPVVGNKMLMLKVDYTTNAFEGGTELTFADTDETAFTIDVDYQTPSDFGWVRMFYTEVNTKFFDGEIHWMGLGNLNYPEDFDPATSFAYVLTEDFITPAGGFDNIFNPSGQEYDYQLPWSQVQGLVKVRQYLATNPTASAKIFLYTPSVGIGDPADWDWIIILKS